MKKSFILILAATILIFIGGFFLVNRGQKTSIPKTYPPPVNLTLYWGNGCPHCKIVDDFISNWNKKDKVTIDKKEVWYNTANASELQARYASCGITNPNDMGVPLLFTPDGKCFSGDQPVINYLKTL